MTEPLPSEVTPGPDHEAPQPEPVLDLARVAVAVSGLVGAVGALCVLIGWATQDQVQSWVIITGGIVSALGTVVAVVAPLVAAYRARAQVTPLVSPRDARGVRLVPIDRRAA